MTPDESSLTDARNSQAGSGCRERNGAALNTSTSIDDKPGVADTGLSGLIPYEAIVGGATAAVDTYPRYSSNSCGGAINTSALNDDGVIIAITDKPAGIE